VTSPVSRPAGVARLAGFPRRTLQIRSAGLVAITLAEQAGRALATGEAAPSVP
jgi:hypothetical protein